MCFCHMLIACDFCNCYLGLNPQYKKNIVGLRTHYKLYNGTHHDLAEFSDAALTNKDFWEKRTEVELHAQWYPVQKLQIIFSLPYIYNIEGMSAPAQLAFGNPIAFVGLCYATRKSTLSTVYQGSVGA